MKRLARKRESPFTPNEKYAALVEMAGYVPVALSSEDYIELLPATWRAINAYGIKIDHRVYDGADLSPLRGQRSGVKARKDLWEIHRDPYDVSRIWVRDHHAPREGHGDDGSEDQGGRVAEPVVGPVLPAGDNPFVQ